MQENISNSIVYNDGELELKVSVEQESVWLNRNQIAELFGRDVKTIGKHINNIFIEGELIKFSVVANFATTASDGKIYDVEYYNLDVIISVGYRVKSQKGVRFRQWATSILKNYIQNGYAINHHKITEQRLFELENDMKIIKSKIKDNSLEFIQNIFYDGQIYDAYSFINDLLKLDFEKYKKQYQNIELKEFKNSHDRFLIIDKKEIYHLGASLKDLGKKWFAFSKFDIQSFDILERVKQNCHKT